MLKYFFACRRLYNNICEIYYLRLNASMCAQVLGLKYWIEYESFIIHLLPFFCFTLLVFCLKLPMICSTVRIIFSIIFYFFFTSCHRGGLVGNHANETSRLEKISSQFCGQKNRYNNAIEKKTNKNVCMKQSVFYSFLFYSLNFLILLTNEWFIQDSTGGFPRLFIIFTWWKNKYTYIKKDKK